jgi:hypothetical protein
MALPTPWRVVQSLTIMPGQLNALWPNRSRASDGAVADDAHTATSDHYPHRVPALGSGYMVTARDVTHDPAHGADMGAMTEALRRSRDPRLKYVIFNRNIFSNPAYSHASYQWAWRPYDGSDPHTGHAHISVLDALIADNISPWQLTLDGGGAMSAHTDALIDAWNNGLTTAGDGSPCYLTARTIRHERWMDQYGPVLDHIKTAVDAPPATPVSVDGAAIAEALVANPGFRLMLSEAVESAIARVRIVVDPAVTP